MPTLAGRGRSTLATSNLTNHHTHPHTHTQHTHGTADNAHTTTKQKLASPPPGLQIVACHHISPLLLLLPLLLLARPIKVFRQVITLVAQVLDGVHEHFRRFDVRRGGPHRHNEAVLKRVRHHVAGKGHVAVQEQLHADQVAYGVVFLVEGEGSGVLNGSRRVVRYLLLIFVCRGKQ